MSWYFGRHAGEMCAANKEAFAAVIMTHDMLVCNM